MELKDFEEVVGLRGYRTCLDFRNCQIPCANRMGT